MKSDKQPGLNNTIRNSSVHGADKQSLKGS